MNPKSILVTGSTRGIGHAIALRFAKEGYNIIINGARSSEALQTTKAEIESFGVQCLAFLGDMGEYETVKKLFEEIRQSFGTLDVLVNNAGISHIGLFTDMKPEDWHNIVTTNLYSVFNTCSFAVPMMVSKQQGKIINISSVWGNVGASCEAIYSATKGGMNSFTKALAKELAPSHIQVNAIACGAIDTAMNHCLDEESLSELIYEIPANRLGRPEEVADLVYILAQKNDYLTGQVITLDGGWI